MIGRGNLLSAVLNITVISAFVCGCSSRPSERQTLSDLQKWFESRWPNTLSVVEYRQLSEEVDNGKYIVNYKAKVIFLKDTEGCVSTCCGDVCFDKRIEGFRWITKESQNPHIIRKGDLFEVEGRNAYHKNVKGWLRDET